MRPQKQSSFDANDSRSSSPHQNGHNQGTASTKQASGPRRQIRQQQQGKLRRIPRILPPIQWWILLSTVAVVIRQISKNCPTYLSSLYHLEDEHDNDHYVDVITAAILSIKQNNNSKKQLPKATGKRKQLSAYSTNSSSTIPSIAFLFVVHDQRLDEQMWKRWFENAEDRRMYSIFVHGNHQERPRINTITNITTITTTTSLIDYNITVNSTSEILNNHTEPVDKKILPLGSFFCPYTISTVPSEWFWLYDVQIHLLAEAYKNDPSATHFVYVSDTSIPLMSFNDMYEHLLHHPTSIFRRHRKRTNNSSDDTSTQNPIYRSRFCYFNQQRSEHAWIHPLKELTIPRNKIRKAEMWSILSRSHVTILLQKRETLNHWNQVFYNMSMIHGQGGPGVGAPDENLFPTFLQLTVPPYEIIQNCTKGQNSVKGCCSTMTFWQNHPSRVFTNEYDKSSPTFLSVEEKQLLMKQIKQENYTNKNRVKLSDTCSDRRPCQFYDFLYEDGLIRLKELGFFFLRKVPYTHPIVISNTTTTSFMPEEKMMVDSGDGTTKIPAKVQRTIITNVVTTKIIRNNIKVKTSQGKVVPLQHALSTQLHQHRPRQKEEVNNIKVKTAQGTLVPLQHTLSPQLHPHRPIVRPRQKKEEVNSNRRFVCYATQPAIISTTSPTSGKSWHDKINEDQSDDDSDEDEDIKYMNIVDNAFIEDSTVG